MPVILRPEDYEMWLDVGVRRAELLRHLLCPYPHGEMSAYAVSPLVNCEHHRHRFNFLS
jgi:putative SOS response-associated peptidase YedK